MDGTAMRSYTVRRSEKFCPCFPNRRPPPSTPSLAGCPDNGAGWLPRYKSGRRRRACEMSWGHRRAGRRVGRRQLPADGFQRGLLARPAHAVFAHTAAEGGVGQNVEDRLSQFLDATGSDQAGLGAADLAVYADLIGKDYGATASQGFHQGDDEAFGIGWQYEDTRAG